MNLSGSALLAVFLVVWLLAAPALSQSLEEGTYRLTTKWLGAQKALDVVNDGTDSQVYLAKTQENLSGQQWKLTPAGNGYFRITSKWLGVERSLEAANTVTRDTIRLAATANVTGQLWKIERLRGSYYRLTTKWLGPDRSLDVVNDSDNSSLTLAETSNVAGQFWKVELISRERIPTSIRPLKDFKQHNIQGFNVNVHPELAGHSAIADVLERIDHDLAGMVRLIKSSQTEQLRKIPIWVQYKFVKDGLLWYHTSKDWLAANDYPIKLENSIEISNVAAFLRLEKEKPHGLLHEFAHAYQDLYIPRLQEALGSAFKLAVASKKYELVANENGSKMRAYAITDETEYFAELSEAYFGINDFYPFTRKELAEFDKAGYRLMQEAWGE